MDSPLSLPILPQGSRSRMCTFAASKKFFSDFKISDCCLQGETILVACLYLSAQIFLQHVYFQNYSINLIEIFTVVDDNIAGDTWFECARASISLIYNTQYSYFVRPIFLKIFRCTVGYTVSL